MNSLIAHAIITAYLVSRPPMQLTVTQPFSLVIIIAMVSYNLKEYSISLMGNCLPAQFQSLVDRYPLLSCGFFNNRLVFSGIMYSVVVLSTSKLLLLKMPGAYHVANHGRITKVCLIMFGLYFVIDTTVYLGMGNIYYCHDFTARRLGHIYNLTMDVELLRSQHILLLHTILDKIYLMAMVVLEILILGVSQRSSVMELCSKARAELRTQFRHLFSITGKLAQVKLFNERVIDFVLKY